MSTVVPSQPNISSIEFSPDSKVLAVATRGTGTVELGPSATPTAGAAGLGHLARPMETPPPPHRQQPPEDMTFTGGDGNLAISNGTATFLVSTGPGRAHLPPVRVHRNPDQPRPMAAGFAPGIPYQQPCP